MIIKNFDIHERYFRPYIKSVLNIKDIFLALNVIKLI